MQKQQVFKVKGMQRDASMANANGEFAYEILNMRLMPAEDLSGFSLTNEKGTTRVITGISGQVIGQCPTNDSLIVFTTSNSQDCIYKIFQNADETWGSTCLYSGNLNFSVDHPIEALFNYETKDIQKVYWIDGINQLRCINLEDYGKVAWNDSSFDSVKQIESLPTVEIERTVGGNFTAGVLQYYISYFTEFGTESPLVYTSPLLYLAHENRGGNVNDPVSTAFKLKLDSLDRTNWDSIRIYVTHRTSLEATPEASIIQEFKIPTEGPIEFTDYGLNRVSISPNDLYFVGGKFVKVGTMTVKDQVMFLGNLNIENSSTINFVKIQEMFDFLREEGNQNYLKTHTRKQKENILVEYEKTKYYYKNQLNNVEPITHYKYGEKYRFGISLMDSYGNWSNPIWIKDAFIDISPEQVDSNILELPCPQLDLSITVTYINEDNVSTSSSLLEFLQFCGVKSIKPLVVFPKEEERKVVAQGVVCPTVYNLKDRKENGPYAQASWFMRPNAPVDLWGIKSSQFGKTNISVAQSSDGENEFILPLLSHKSDIQLVGKSNSLASYYGINKTDLENVEHTYNNGLTAFDYMYDDFSSTYVDGAGTRRYLGIVQSFHKTSPLNPQWVLDSNKETLDTIQQKKIISKGNWVEFRHNYALRTKGWSFGAITPSQTWADPILSGHDENYGMVRGAEIDTTKFSSIQPVNRFSTVTQYSTLEKNGQYIEIGSTNANSGTIYNGRSLDILILYKVPQDGRYILLQTVTGKEIVDGPYRGFTFQYNNVTYSGEMSTAPWYPDVYYPGLDYPVALYNWNQFSLGDRQQLIEQMFPEEIIIPGTIDSSLLYPDSCTFSNSAYYVDSSIITLNSPEVEIQNHNIATQDLKFRIVGCIPLTATMSDISLEIDNPAPDPKAGAYGRVGLHKVKLQNENIGYHGFKGTVAANAYYANYKGTTDADHYYGMVPLYPWNSVGSLIMDKSTTVDKKSTLKKKILSNLRFSANTYFFPQNTIALDYDSSENYAYTDNASVGWKPAYGHEIAIYQNPETTPIIKFGNLEYLNTEIIYRGSTSEEGSLAILTTGLSETPCPSFIYGFGLNPSHLYDLASDRVDPEVLLASPARYLANQNYEKTSVGAPIIYKSSPHFIVSFTATKLKNRDLWMQETLPTWRTLNEEGLTTDYIAWYENKLDHGHQFQNDKLSSLYHQSYIRCQNTNLNFGLPGYIPSRTETISYGEYIPHWSLAGTEIRTLQIYPNGNVSTVQWRPIGSVQSYLNINKSTSTEIKIQGTGLENLQNDVNHWHSSSLTCTITISPTCFDALISKMNALVVGESYTWNEDTGVTVTLQTTYNKPNKIIREDCQIKIVKRSSSTVRQYAEVTITHPLGEEQNNRFRIILDGLCFHQYYIPAESTFVPNYGWLWLGEIYREQDPTFGGTSEFALLNNQWETAGNIVTLTNGALACEWTRGDTYYQRFDTLKTYAYSDSDKNSIVDITSFMVETHINIDGRTDRNRGQESNLQMSPTNFNLMNDVYSQRDNFFTYRILDDDLQARTNFPNQITWSLTKTAGATVDAWMNITLASVLDLDGTKGELIALKNFNNNIIAFQEKGLSNIMFNSRAQIATSEAVPIQIANTGKVDGQQYFTTDVGCQDKWNIVTTPNGIYFVDYFNNSIYKFNGQLEDISTPNGFRSWCYENLDSNANIIGYYDVKNKEVMYYIGDTGFMLDNSIHPNWLGFSELTGAFSSFYTYPKAWFASIKDRGIWLLSDTRRGISVYAHQMGNYNSLLNTAKNHYGITVIPRQDSNTVKTFNNVEFRSDSFDGNGYNESILPFDTISAETEYQTRTPKTLTYSPYRPSNLKKKFRTWRANIPRVNNGYNRFVNQWAKIGLWKMNPSTEKTILHDLSVWYSE